MTSTDTTTLGHNHDFVGVEQLEQLETFTCERCREFGDQTLERLDGLSHLRELRLTHGQITDRGLLSLLGHDELEVLDRKIR